MVLLFATGLLATPLLALCCACLGRFVLCAKGGFCDTPDGLAPVGVGFVEWVWGLVLWSCFCGGFLGRFCGWCWGIVNAPGGASSWRVGEFWSSPVAAMVND